VDIWIFFTVYKASGSVLGLVERVERFDKQRTEETSDATLMSRGGQVGRLELGYETLQTRVKLERQQQVQHLHRPILTPHDMQ